MTQNYFAVHKLIYQGVANLRNVLNRCKNKIVLLADNLLTLCCVSWVEHITVHRRPTNVNNMQTETAKSNITNRSVPRTQNEVVVTDVTQYDDYDIQSGMESSFTIMEPTKSMKSELLTFEDQNPAYDYAVDGTPDSTYGQADTSDVGLAEWFYRPLKVASFEWGTGNLLFEKFNPWKLFFENPRNINRLSNYALLRCKLNVKIVINGNGFHYGRAIASYNPLPGEDELTVDRAFFTQDVVAASQRPHFYMDPTTSQGGSMRLPFFFPKNALAIPIAEWDRMGEITVQSMQNLKHANGATDRVTLSVFVWAEDLSLSMPTSTNAGQIAPQSGYEPHSGMSVMGSKDEYGTGVISRPASLIAKAAGALKNAPMIGPYAKATQMAASATAGIASLFGYSRPAIINDIVPYKPTYAGNLANTNVPDSVQRLTMDVKQEVTVDPRVTGLSGEDEMAIRPLAMRESYVTQFAWQVADPTEQLLWNSKVTPAMFDRNPITDPPETHMTPSCWVGMPFKNWRGSMKFRFQVVSSNFHKGRLKVVYEPYASVSNEYNTNYTYVLDIAEQKDFTVKIGWGNSLGYLEYENPGTTTTVPFSTTPIGATAATAFNGIIKVYVVNELTVPNSSIDNDISVNVFTSMCEDYDVANPTDDYLNGWSIYPPQEGLFEPQSGVEAAQVDGENTDAPSAPIQMDPPTQLGKECLDETDHAVDVYYGEAITSIRQCLKRYCYHATFAPRSIGARLFTRRQNNLPFYRGYNTNGIHTTQVGQPYNYCKTTVLNWYLPAYAAYRGSLRWKYINSLETATSSAGTLADADTQLTTGAMSVTRDVTPTTGYSENTSNELVNTSPSQFARQGVITQRSTFAGSTMTYKQGNNAIEVEMPWYSNLRFGYAKKSNLTTSVVNNYYHTLQTRSNIGIGSVTQYDTFCAIGEDFNLMFFLGPPLVYWYGAAEPSPLP